MKSLPSLWQRALCTLLALLLALPANVVVGLAQSSGAQIGVNDGSPSRSVVTNLTFTLTNGLVPAAVSLNRLPFGPALDPNSLLVTSLEVSNTYRLSFTNLPGNRLPDGNYLASVVATPGTNLAGPRKADSLPIHALFGDQDGDRDVDFFDTFGFRSTWLSDGADSQFDARFDADGNGVVDAGDLAQFSTNYFTLLPPQAGAFAFLEIDDGTNAGDNRTTVATVVGRVIVTNALSRVEAALRQVLSPIPFRFGPITGDLVENTFRLDSNRLAEMSGQALLDGAHQFAVRVVENDGSESARFVLPFSLGESREVCFDSLSGWEVSAASTGSAEKPPGRVAIEECDAVLVEGNSFLVTLSKDIRIPEGAAVLSFDFRDPEFDSSALGSMRDAFEVAVTSISGELLSYSVQGQAGIVSAATINPPALPAVPSAILNITEGMPPSWAPGSLLTALSDGRRRGYLDLSSLGAGTMVRLAFRLVNNDGDSQSQVRIRGFAFGSELPGGLSSGGEVPAFSTLTGSARTPTPIGALSSGPLRKTPIAPVGSLIESSSLRLDSPSEEPSFPVATNITAPPGFLVHTYSLVEGVCAIAFPPEGSAFGSNLYAATDPDAGFHWAGPEKIYRIEADGAATVIASLPLHAGPWNMDFPPLGSQFGDFLYISANDMDNAPLDGLDGGGTIVRMDHSGSWTNFTGIGWRNGGPTEPTGIAFGYGTSFGDRLFIANSSDRPSDITQVDPQGTVTNYFDGGGEYVPFSPLIVGKGHWRDLLLFRNGETVVGLNAQPSATNLYSSLASSLAIPTRGPFGDYIYLTRTSGNDRRIVRIAPDGTEEIFAYGFGPQAGVFHLISMDNLEFTPDGLTLFVADWAQGKIYRIIPTQMPAVLYVSAAGLPEERPAGTTISLSGVAGYSGGTLDRGEIQAVRVNGAPVEALDAQGHFFTTVTVKPGQNTFRIEALDSLGAVAFTEVQTVGATGDVVESSSLAVVTGALDPKYSRTGLAASGKVVYADLALKNIGTYALQTPLLIGVRAISDPTVTLLDADGVTKDGVPYYDYSLATRSGSFSPGSESERRTLAFHNPGDVQFSYELVALGRLNEAPYFTTTPVISATAGRPYSYDAKATDPDGDSVTFECGIAPEGLTVDAATGALTWIPTTAQLGNQEIALSAADGRGGSALQRFIVTVSEPSSNRPPVFVSTPVTVARVSSPGIASYIYQARAADPDADAISYSLLGNVPTGFHLESGSGQVSWAPTADQVGEHPLTIRADDGRGGVALQSFVICVLPDASNRPPIIADVGPTEYFGIPADDNTTTLQVTIRDFSTNHVDFGKPTGLGVTPGIVETNLGPDGRPVFAHPGPVGSISGPDSFRQWFNDVPGVNQRTNLALTLTASSQYPRVFEFYKWDFAPINDQLGGNEGYIRNAHFTVEAHAQIRYLGGEVLSFASDDDMWVFLEGRLVIDLGGVHGERASQLHLDELGLTKGQIYSLDCFYAERYLGGVLGLAIVHDQVPSVSVDYQGAVAALDPDSHVLTYELVSGPAGLVVDPQTGDLRWTANGVNVGPHSVTVRARDDRGGTDERSFVINVRGSGNGTIIGEVLSDTDGDDLPDIFGEDGWEVYLDLNRNSRRDIGEPTGTTDFQGYVIGGVPSGTYSLALEVLPGWSVAVPSTGAHEITLGDEELIERSFIVREGLDPDPHFVSVPGPQTVRVGSSFVYQPITRGFDSGTLRYELISPPFGMVVHTNTGLLAWRPSRDELGVHEVIIRASDGAGRSAIQAISVSVSPANSAPFLITSLPTTAVVDQLYTLQLQAQDSEGHTVHFGVTNPPVGFSLNSTNGIVSWTPILAQVGPQVIDLVAIDSEGDTSRKAFEVEVRPLAPNSPPQIVTNPRIQTRFGSPWLYVARAIDPDANPLSFALVSGPEGMTLTNSLIGLDGAVLEPPFNGALFTWTPKSDQLGTNEVTIDVSDGRGGKATQTFQVVVGNSFANSPPAIVSSPPEQATAGQTYEYDLVGVDPDGDALQWRIVIGPDGASLNPETGSLRWIPTLDQLGTNQFVVEVSDGLLGADRQEFFVEVGCVNRPPNIVSTPPVAAAKEATYLYAARASDPDDDLISWNLEQAPSGMTIDSTNGLLRWVVPADAFGPQLVQLRATDGRGGSDTQSYTLHVTDEKANQPPVITSTPPRGAASGQAYQYELAATDADGDVLSLQLLQAPTGATLLPGPSSPGRVSGTVRWLPPHSLVGSMDFIVSAKDPSGASSGQRFSVTVRANEAPRITSTPRTNAIPEISYYYDVRATDPERDPLSYQLVQAPIGMTIDGFGRIQWLPTQSDLGEHTVLIKVGDGFGGATQQQFSVTVVADNIPPVVTLNLISGFIQNGVWTGDLGSSVSVQVKATDNVGVVERVLRVGDRSYPLNTSGVATIPITTGGLFLLTGVARDAAGNVGSASRSIQFYDPNAPNSLLVSILSPTNGAVISKKVPIIATISNAVPIVKYQVDFAPADQVNLNNIAEGNPAWTTLSEVTLDQPVTLLQAVTVATFDPLSLLNDSYVIRVYAQDEAGQGWYEPVVVGIEGDLKFGEFRIAFTDLTIPLAGIPVTVSRVYDSRVANRVGDFGYGWSLGLQDAMIRVGTPEGIVQPGARVYLTGPDGRRIGFTTDIRVTGGAWVVAATRMFFRPDAGVFDRLEADGLDNVYFGSTSLNDVFDSQLTLDTARLFTRDGTRYEYSRTEGLQTITDTSGNSIRYTRDGIFHYPAGSTNSDQSIQFVRDARGRIERIIDPAGLPLLYTYDAAGDLRAFTDQATNITQYAYDSARAHFLTNIVDPFGKNALGLVYENGVLKEVRDAAGNPIKQDFDADENVGTFTDGRGTQTIVHFDDRGNETVRMIPGLSTNYFAYDQNNNLIGATNANGYTTNFVYDARGNVTRITDALTNITEIAYNELGKPTAVTNALGQVLRLQYNAAGQLTEVINNLGYVTRVGRDSQGRVTNLVDAVGNTNSFVYEGGCSCGRPGIVFNPDGSFRRYEYDSFGRTNLVVNELGATNRFNYAADGRLLWVEDPMTNRTTYHYEGPRLTNIEDALGRKTHFLYDDFGRTNFIITAEGGTNEFRYDANGNRTHVIDAVGNVTRFVYDAANRVTNRIDTFNNTNHFVLDAMGNQIETIDRNKRRRTFANDALGRMTNEVWWEGSNIIKSIVFSFNELGVQTLALDQDVARFDYQFDALNRLERVVQSLTAGQSDFILSYTYTPNGQVKTVTDNRGVQVGSEYDNRNTLRSRTWHDVGEETELSVGEARVDFEFDKAGNRIRTERYADLPGTDLTGFTTNAYNIAGIVTNITHLGPTGEPLARYDYQFDEAWQIRQWTISRPSLGDAQFSTFGYDRTGQLTNAFNSAQPNENFRYDANGNREAAQSSGNYVVGGNNQILSDGTNSYTYDFEGNMASRSNTVTGVLTTYQWDHRNRLMSVLDDNPGGVVTQTVSFVYDAMNRRLAKTVTGPQGTDSVRFLYNQDDSWADLDGANAVIARYLHGARIDELLARQRASDGRGWYLTDHVGTIRDIADATGTAVARFEYTSFGQTHSESNPLAADRFLFTGRELDDETGLYFYRARYYSPVLGVFASQDPIGFESLDYNLYRYAVNNPYSLTDPTGTTFIERVLLSAAAGALVGLVTGLFSYAAGGTNPKRSAEIAAKCAALTFLFVGTAPGVVLVAVVFGPILSGFNDFMDNQVGNGVTAVLKQQLPGFPEWVYEYIVSCGPGVFEP